MILELMKKEAALPGRVNTFPARLMLLDNRRLMKFNNRHADLDLPRVVFSNGASSIANMRAAEFLPLMWQLMIVLGAGDEALLLDPVTTKPKVVSTLYHLVWLRSRLWKPEITFVEVRGIEQTIGL